MTNVATPVPTTAAPVAAPDRRGENDVWQQLWLGISVPGSAQIKIAAGLQQYPQYIEQEIPRDRWHVTLLWLGDVKNPRQYYGRLMQPMTTSFVPTVRVTHVGRGLNKHQLWAYADPSTVLTALREEFIKRLKSMRYRFADPDRHNDFVPHVAVARLFRMAGGIGMADAPASVSWPVRAIHLFRTEQIPDGPRYHIERTVTVRA